MQENSINIAEIAKKQRYSHLLNKIKSGKALSSAEIKELDRYESMSKKKEKPEQKRPQKGVEKHEAQQEAFCRQWVIDFNGERAAIEAGYSKKTAKVQASQLLTRLNIQNRIKELMIEREKRTEIKADRVLEELAKLAFSNIADFLEKTKNGLTLKDFEKMPREQLACIEEISEYETDNGNKRFRFKLYSKEKALELAMRHLAMLTDNVKHEFPEGCGVLAVPVGMTKEQWKQFAKKIQSQGKK